MSKIIVLVGSVRKNGNTEMLANAFCEGVKDKGDIQNNYALEKAAVLGKSLK